MEELADEHAGDRASDRGDRDEPIEPRRAPEPLERRHEHPQHEQAEQQRQELGLEERARDEGPHAVVTEHVARRRHEVLGQGRLGLLVDQQEHQRDPELEAGDDQGAARDPQLARVKAWSSSTITHARTLAQAGFTTP